MDEAIASHFFAAFLLRKRHDAILIPLPNFQNTNHYLRRDSVVTLEGPLTLICLRIFQFYRLFRVIFFPTTLVLTRVFGQAGFVLAQAINDQAFGASHYTIDDIFKRPNLKEVNFVPLRLLVVLGYLSKAHIATASEEKVFKENFQLPSIASLEFAALWFSF
ncbi:hypothetical protein F4776DRAFT_660125 [Hypoxylon sp. NC0597]|nr:hypothetical protein F4776DRAFT_660125 [Hypoxylon sp. NC0597]